VSKARRQSLVATIHFYSVLMVLQGWATKSNLTSNERDEVCSWAVDGGDQGKIRLIYAFYFACL
jgi:hypothetical protein